MKSTRIVSVRLLGMAVAMLAARAVAGEPSAVLPRLEDFDKRLLPCLVIGTVEGEHTDFVRDVPDAVARQCERITMTADTAGSVVSRHTTAPWLYPYQGKGEIPRAFAEDGRQYYPIWGTWRRRLESGWHTYDHNNKAMDDKKETMPHWESKVDYFVVSAPQAPPVRVTVELDDGSRLKGVAGVAAIAVRTPYATLSLPLVEIASFQFNTDRETAVFLLRNGDKITGAVNLNCLAVDAVFGRITVPLGHVKQVVLEIDKSDPLAGGLVLHYTFDDADYAATGTFHERTGKGPVLRACGTAVTQVQGIRGKAASLGPGYLACDSNPTAGLENMTLSLWFKTPNPGADLKLASAAWWHGGPNASGWNMGTWYSECWADDRKPMFVEGKQKLFKAKRELPANQWNHLAITFDRKTYCEYINGELYRRDECTGAPIGRGANLIVGGWMTGGFQFRGEIDEFRVYNRALSAEDVRALYAGRFIDMPTGAVLTGPPGEFQLDYAGLRWDLMRTGWKVEDGKLASQRHVRPGFQYGHWANGRGGLALTGNGDRNWVDYEAAFDYKMLPANREFFHAYIPGDSRGMSVVFRAKSISESWNQPSTSYSFALSPDGGWSLGAAEDSYMAGHGWSAENRKGKQETLATGKSKSGKDVGEGRLRMRVRGNTIAVWLNDEQLVEHTHQGKVVELIPYGGFGVQWRFESMGWLSNLEVQRL